jgi:hypothetical protein
VRLHDGALVAHADEDLADRLLAAGAAVSCRTGSRRYLRLRRDIIVLRTARGWDVVEYLRSSLGDKQTAAYFAHKDCQSEQLRYIPPIRALEAPKPDKTLRNRDQEKKS